MSCVNIYRCCLIVGKRCAPKFNFISSGVMEAWHPVWNNRSFYEIGIMNNKKVYQGKLGFPAWIYYFQTENNPGQWQVFLQINRYKDVLLLWFQLKIYCKNSVQSYFRGLVAVYFLWHDMMSLISNVRKHVLIIANTGWLESEDTNGQEELGDRVCNWIKL